MLGAAWPAKWEPLQQLRALEPLHPAVDEAGTIRVGQFNVGDALLPDQRKHRGPHPEDKQLFAR